MNRSLHDIADLLLAIEAEMRRIELWDQEPPSPQALASTMPFCYDTLQFHQWIQWILLARLRQLIEQGMPLPGNSEIFPLAEHSFAELPHKTDRLLQLIADLDRALNAQR